MLPSWQSLLRWKPLKTEGLRRAADGIKPLETIDLTASPDDERPVIGPLHDSNNGLYSCPICMSPLEQPVATMCGHVFCKKCLTGALIPFHNCPMCKKDVQNFIRIYT
ncbi:E3 ubiquitin-protein ligase RNF125 [Drosophila santomea]|uniref:E3 ubiquitin-protein ligase RNF125 n=1 Tax=Drosophila santomea TaxID=129105 RepID=UPI001954995A|nr:E3 ubiquitin-protein ligase RNF125 [Drosophila santomea]